jgi:hypothetical protein
MQRRFLQVMSSRRFNTTLDSSDSMRRHSARHWRDWRLILERQLLAVRTRYSSFGLDIADASAVCPSHAGEARRLQKSGGLYLNGVAMTDASRVLESSDFSGEADGHGAYALLRVGKTEHRVLWLASSSSSSSP